jgi:hypothetical protein
MNTEESYGSIDSEANAKTALNGLLMLSKKSSELTKKDSNEQICQSLSIIEPSIFLTPCPSPIQDRKRIHRVGKLVFSYFLLVFTYNIHCKLLYINYIL